MDPSSTESPDKQPNNPGDLKPPMPGTSTETPPPANILDSLEIETPSQIDFPNDPNVNTEVDASEQPEIESDASKTQSPHISFAESDTSIKGTPNNTPTKKVHWSDTLTTQTESGSVGDAHPQGKLNDGINKDSNFVLPELGVTTSCVDETLADQLHTNPDNNDDYNNNDNDDDDGYVSDTDGIDAFAVDFTGESTEETMKQKYVYYLSLPHQT
jgi:hypothetical protein